MLSPKLIHMAMLAVFAWPGLHCQTPGAADKADFVYENEYGSIRILPNDKDWRRVIYANNSGDTFDTLLTVNPKMTLVPQDSAFPFLSLRWGGVEWNANRAYIREFSGLAFLAQFVHIERMYERPFYRTGQPVTVRGKITRDRNGAQVDGIYLDGYTGAESGYVIARGTVRKEPYPRGFYAADDSLQRILADDSQVHYCLVMENGRLEKPAVRRMTGYARNVNGQAHFLWEFADSESYRLEGRKPWTPEEEHRIITVEGILVQDFSGSVLWDWKIIE